MFGGFFLLNDQMCFFPFQSVFEPKKPKKSFLSLSFFKNRKIMPPTPLSSSTRPASVFAYNTGLRCNTVTVNLNTVRNNIRAIKQFQTPPPLSQQQQNSPTATHHQQKPPIFMAVIKDNAYSTDMLQMAKALAHDDKEQLVDGFMVAHFSEARMLRDSGILLPSSSADVSENNSKKLLAIYAESCDYEDVIKLDVETCVDTAEQIEQLAKVASKIGKPARVHLHVNTGMNRLGCLPEEALPLAKKIAERVENNELVFSGLKTHLSTADETDHDFSFDQEHKFHEVIASVLQTAHESGKSSIVPDVIHSQNTAWALRYQPWLEPPAQYNTYFKEIMQMGHAWPRRMLRIGIGMYGFCALEVENTHKLLKPAVTIRSQIASIHTPPAGWPISYARKFYAPEGHEGDFKIATIPQGYGEGVTRWPDNFVCIRGKRCPIVGKITMDFIMVDVTELGDAVKVGDSVLLFGKEEEVAENLGSEVEIHMASTAAGTSPHQFMARGGYRLRRVFTPFDE